MANLYTIINEVKRKGVSPIGYTLTGYQGVLAALQKQSVKVVDRIIQQQGASMSNRYHTLLSDLPLDANDINRDGFFYNNNQQPLFQAVCTIKDYMSFPVDCNTKDGLKKSYVSVERGVSNGRSQRSGITFPPANLDEQTMKTFSENCQTCYIGVGISFEELGQQFFKTFFPQLNLSHGKIQQLASKGYLYAQVIIPDKGNNAKVLHAKVTVNQSQSSTGPYNVFVPIPILLLNDYSSLGSVVVKMGEGQQKVGSGSVSFPLANSGYNHTTAELYDLTPQMLRAHIDQENAVTTKYVGSTLCSGGTEKTGRVRLYLSQEAKSELGALSDQNAAQLFKGTTTPNVKTTQVSTSLEEVYKNDGKLSVIIDIGHHSSYNQYKTWDEHMLAQHVAKELKSLLQSNGIRSVIIDSDSNLCPSHISSQMKAWEGEAPRTIKGKKTIRNDWERYATAKMIRHLAPSFTCYVSLHLDAASPSAKGGHSIYGSNHPKNKSLGIIMATEIVKVLPGRSNPPGHTVPAYPRDLQVTRISEIPGCLVECGFYTNQNDVKIVRDTDKVPRAIYNAIIKWYNSNG